MDISFEYESTFASNIGGEPNSKKEVDKLFIRSAWALEDGAHELLDRHSNPAEPLDEPEFASELQPYVWSRSTADHERRSYLVKSVVAYVRTKRALAEGLIGLARFQLSEARYWEGKAEGDYEAWEAIEQKLKVAAARTKSRRSKIERLKGEVIRNLHRLAPKHGWRSQNQAMKAIEPALCDFIDRENTPWLELHLDNHLHDWIYDDVEAVAAYKDIPASSD